MPMKSAAIPAVALMLAAAVGYLMNR